MIFERNKRKWFAVPRVGIQVQLSAVTQLERLRANEEAVRYGEGNTPSIDVASIQKSNRRAVLEHCHDWRGITDGDGKEIAFTPEIWSAFIDNTGSLLVEEDKSLFAWVKDTIFDSEKFFEDIAPLSIASNLAGNTGGIGS